MLQALFWGLVTSGSLLVGAVLALALRPGGRTIGLALAFGSGALISAVAYDLVLDAFDDGAGGVAGDRTDRGSARLLRRGRRDRPYGRARAQERARGAPGRRRAAGDRARRGAGRDSRVDRARGDPRRGWRGVGRLRRGRALLEPARGHLGLERAWPRRAGRGTASSRCGRSWSPRRRGRGRRVRAVRRGRGARRVVRPRVRGGGGPRDARRHDDAGGVRARRPRRRPDDDARVRGRLRARAGRAEAPRADAPVRRAPPY